MCIAFSYQMLQKYISRKTIKSSFIFINNLHLHPGPAKQPLFLCSRFYLAKNSNCYRFYSYSKIFIPTNRTFILQCPQLYHPTKLSLAVQKRPVQ